MSVMTPLIAAPLPGGVPLLTPSVTRAVSRLVDDAPTALDPRVEDSEDSEDSEDGQSEDGQSEDGQSEDGQSEDGQSEDGQYVEDVILWPGVTKRDRIPLAPRDWLSRLCLRQGATRIADRLFPRLAPLARDQALLALLAAEANGDGYLVGRNPWTGRLERLPSPNDHVIVEPQRFLLYWFVSEHPADLGGDWRSLKGWSLRWQAWGTWRWVSVSCPAVSASLDAASGRGDHAPFALTIGHQAPVGLPGLPGLPGLLRPRQCGAQETRERIDPTNVSPAAGSTDGWTPGGTR